MELLLHDVVFWVESSKYLLVFILTFFEGPAAMVTTGFLVRLGEFSFLTAYSILVAADFAADITWYLLGRFGARSLTSKICVIFNVPFGAVDQMEERFKKHHLGILVVMKLTMGFGFSAAALLAAGMFKISFKKYAIITFIGGLIWTFLLMALGFTYGHLYTLVPEKLKVAFVCIGAAAFVALILGLNRYFKSLESKHT